MFCEGGRYDLTSGSASPFHRYTVKYYTELADTLIGMGADEICIKDMAGVGRPATIGRIIKQIKEKHANIPVTYHGQAGPGFQMASILEAAHAGAEYIDVAMEPLSWGTVMPTCWRCRQC